MYEVVLQWVNHLGNIVNCYLKETDGILLKKCDLIGHVNKVLWEFPNVPDSVTG